MAKKTTRKRRTAITRPAEDPRPKRYSPPPCNSCQELRETLGKGSENYTECMTGPRSNSETIVRYLRCKFCGRTWKDTQMVGQAELSAR